MKLPRIECRDCGRGIAAGPVAGRLSKGRIWRHDPPGQTRTPGRPLVSCAGSLCIVDLPLPGRQMELDLSEPVTAPAAEPEEVMALF